MGRIVAALVAVLAIAGAFAVPAQVAAARSDAALLHADFDTQTIDAPVGTGGPSVGEPKEVDSAVEAVVRAGPFPTPSLELTDADTYSSGDVAFTFVDGAEVDTGFVSISATLWFDELDFYHVYVREADGAAQSFLSLDFYDGGVSYGDEDTPAGGALATVECGRAIPLAIVFDMTAGRYDVALDGRLILHDEPHGVTGRGVGSVYIGIGHDPDLDGRFHVDDVLVTRGRVALPTSFAASGNVALAGQLDHSGVTISFARAAGTGPLPAPVQTDQTGAWSATGFAVGTTYLAIPSRWGWAFSPDSSSFGAERTNLNFVGEGRTRALLVRAVVGSNRLTSPAQIVVGRRAVIEVLEYTRADQADSTPVAAFALEAPAALGTVSGTAVRLTTVAGVTEWLTATAGDLTQEFAITTLPGAVDHLAIDPADVSLSAGEQVDFAARGADEYGNVFALAGVSVGWHCWPATLGTINANTGVFTAGSAGGQGCVIAVVSRTLRFGDTDASAAGTSKVAVRGAQPGQFALHQNTPNPFNPETVIRFELLEARPVRVEVYNSVGCVVRVLVDQYLAAGSHAVSWDGTDQCGTALASGAYLVRLSAGEFGAVRKALLVR